jgi:hypothetical protein
MSQTKAKSSVLVFQTLKWARQRGFKPVPLRPAQKAAMEGGYTDLKYKPPDDALWTEKDLGVGVVTGPLHGGPVDVDLDCHEALVVAPGYLPKTNAIFGRKSKPKSHYIFNVLDDECTKKIYTDPIDNKVILELRGDGGHQTVFPGSIHEGTGELVEWDNHVFPDVGECQVEELDQACRMIASVVLIARHAWVDGQRNEVCKHIAGMLFFYGWDADDAVKFIKSIMGLHGDTDRTRAITVRSTFRKAEKSGKVTGGPSLVELLGDDKVVNRINKWLGSPAQAIVEEYNARFAVVNLNGRFRVAELVEDSMSRIRYVFMGKEDFKSFTSHEVIQGDKGPVPKALIWLNDTRRRQYQGVCFRPGVEDTGGLINLWPGWPIEPIYDKTKCEAWLRLVKNVICDGDLKTFHWLMGWLANIVQEPTRRPMTAPVIIGRQGVGKSLFLSFFDKILGMSYTMVTQEEHVHGKFNMHLAHTLLLHSEEALFGGDKRHRSIIKSLITDNSRVVEPKGVDAYQVENHIRLILTSNEPWAAGVEFDDRRFTIINCRDKKPTPKLIAAVVKEMDGDGAAALFGYLLKYIYEFDDIRINLKNEGLFNLKRLNLDQIHEWWMELLMQGQLLDDEQQWAQNGTGLWPTVVGSSSLYEKMVKDLKDSRMRTPTRQLFSMELDRLAGLKLKRKQIWFTNSTELDAKANQRQNAITNMPELSECRRVFEKMLNHKIDWPQIDEISRPAHDKY